MHQALLLPILFTIQSANTLDSAIPTLQVKSQPSLIICSRKDDDDDPGKAITDDPHGRDPHGRDPHDENHDKEMPANNLDPYGNKKT
ncbi:MAG TPA: hypothetical protein V6C76_06790 [Drouetiella sp.]